MAAIILTKTSTLFTGLRSGPHVAEPVGIMCWVGFCSLINDFEGEKVNAV